MRVFLINADLMGLFFQSFVSLVLRVMGTLACFSNASQYLFMSNQSCLSCKKKKGKKTFFSFSFFFLAESFGIHLKLFWEQHYKQDKPKQTNLLKITFLSVPTLEPDIFCKPLIVRGLSVCCLAAAVLHPGDFRSNLSGACPSISLSTLSITVQHCQGIGERGSQ